jgi:carboxymethylenebutenolidase
MRTLRILTVMALAIGLSARVGAQQQMQGQGGGQQAPAFTPPVNDKLPPPDARADEQLKNSPRHGEWADIKLDDGKMMKSWVTYPAANDKRGVVIVIFEIFGMNSWVQGVADQIAKEGFIAIAPDLLSGMGPNGGGSAELGTQGVRQAIGQLTPDLRITRLNAAMKYGKSIPSSNGKTGVVGFCWGGGTSLLYAIGQPDLQAAVMYYGPAPTKPGTQEVDLSGLPNIKAPILAHYPSTDNRTLATAQPISDEMKKLGKSFEFHVYQDATHGFMHLRSDADYKAGVESWPMTIAFFQKHLK